jgi:chorismate synthase
VTLGSPIAFSVRNKDWENWQEAMAVETAAEGADLRTVTRPRPGHADLPGGLKYQTHDVRNILERASARETTTRVAVGSFCRLLLARFGIRIGSHVVAVGSEHIAKEFRNPAREQILNLDQEDPIRCLDAGAGQRMMQLIDATKKAGDTLGGCAEIIAGPIPPGLGSHIQWDRRLDGLIAQAMMSIPSVKAVEIGQGLESAANPGSAVHDEIFYNARNKCFSRKTNRAGGVEGGISNGEDIRVQIYPKPIPTLGKPLASVDITTKEPFEAVVERSDVCVVPAAGVVAEAMLAIVLAGAFLEKFGGDSIPETEANLTSYLGMVESY